MCQGDGELDGQTKLDPLLSFLFAFVFYREYEHFFFPSVAVDKCSCQGVEGYKECQIRGLDSVILLVLCQGTFSLEEDNYRGWL